MSDSSPSTKDALPSANLFFPVLNMHWVEGVLNGTYPMPKFRPGDRVRLADDDSCSELDQASQVSASGSSSPVLPEEDADQRGSHVAGGCAEGYLSSCEYPPLIAVRSGLGMQYKICGKTGAATLPTDFNVLSPTSEVSGSLTQPSRVDDAMFDVDTASQECLDALNQLQEEGHKKDSENGTGVESWVKGDSHLDCASTNTTEPDKLETSCKTEDAMTSSETDRSQNINIYEEDLCDDVEVSIDEMVDRNLDFDDPNCVCICLSDMVAGVAMKVRENTLKTLTKTPGSLVKNEMKYPYQKETNPWMVRTFDKKLHAALLRLLDELECLEEVKSHPKRGYGCVDIPSRMYVTINHSIEDVGSLWIAEIKTLKLVQDFLTDMVAHELKCFLPKHRSDHDSIEAMNSIGNMYGLSHRIIFFVQHLMSLFPDASKQYFKKVHASGRRHTAIALERWGGLQGLLNIHENDTIMDALVSCIHSFAFSIFYVKEDRDAIAGIKELHLSEPESTVLKRIWLGMIPLYLVKPIFSVNKVVPRRYDHSPIPLDAKHIEDDNSDIDYDHEYVNIKTDDLNVEDNVPNVEKNVPNIDNDVPNVIKLYTKK